MIEEDKKKCKAIIKFFENTIKFNKELKEASLKGELHLYKDKIYTPKFLKRLSKKGD